MVTEQICSTVLIKPALNNLSATALKKSLFQCFFTFKLCQSLSYRRGENSISSSFQKFQVCAIMTAFFFFTFLCAHVEPEHSQCRTCYPAILFWFLVTGIRAYQGNAKIDRVFIWVTGLLEYLNTTINDRIIGVMSTGTSQTSQSTKPFNI